MRKLRRPRLLTHQPARFGYRLTFERSPPGGSSTAGDGPPCSRAARSKSKIGHNLEAHPFSCFVSRLLDRPLLFLQPSSSRPPLPSKPLSKPLALLQTVGLCHSRAADGQSCDAPPPISPTHPTIAPQSPSSPPPPTPPTTPPKQHAIVALAVLGLRPCAGLDGAPSHDRHVCARCTGEMDHLPCTSTVQRAWPHRNETQTRRHEDDDAANIRID